MLSVRIGPVGCGKSKLLLDFKEFVDTLYGFVPICIKPNVDTRNEGIQSRDGRKVDAIGVDSFRDILKIAENMESSVVYIVDEVQFLKEDGLLEFVKYIHENDIDVICSGLNLTSEMKPFEITSKLCMYADNIYVVNGVCEICGKESKLTKCKVEKTQEILVGDDIYQQTCYKCHNK